MAGRQLVFQPPKFNWDAEDQQLAFAEWRGQIELALEASSIAKVSSELGVLQQAPRSLSSTLS